MKPATACRKAKYSRDTIYIRNNSRDVNSSIAAGPPEPIGKSATVEKSTKCNMDTKCRMPETVWKQHANNSRKSRVTNIIKEQKLSILRHYIKILKIEEVENLTLRDLVIIVVQVAPTTCTKDTPKGHHSKNSKTCHNLIGFSICTQARNHGDINSPKINIYCLKSLQFFTYKIFNYGKL